jgi:hypothetical protein
VTCGSIGYWAESPGTPLDQRVDMRVLLLVALVAIVDLPARAAAPSTGWQEFQWPGAKVQQKSWTLRPGVEVTAIRDAGRGLRGRTIDSRGRQTTVLFGKTPLKRTIFLDEKAALASRKGEVFTLRIPASAKKYLHYEEDVRLSAADRAALLTHQAVGENRYSGASALYGLYWSATQGSPTAFHPNQSYAVPLVINGIDPISVIELPMQDAMRKALERLSTLDEPLVQVHDVVAGPSAHTYTLTPKGLRVAHALRMQAFEPNQPSPMLAGFRAHQTLDEMLSP